MWIPTDETRRGEAAIAAPRPSQTLIQREPAGVMRSREPTMVDAPARNPMPESLSGLGALSFFDLDNLSTAIRSARRADVMRALLGSAVLAVDQIQGSDEMMAPAVALTRATDPLLWKCTHGRKSSSVVGIPGQGIHLGVSDRSLRTGNRCQQMLRPIGFDIFK